MLGRERGKPPPRSTLPVIIHRYDNVDLSPLPWSEFFDREVYYSDPDGRSGRFHCYIKGQIGKLCIVLLHGGGYSGLSFGLLTESLFAIIGHYVEIVAIDLRGHGLTIADEADLELNTLSEDVMAMLNVRFETLPDKWPQIVLVGHSLGGAIAVDVAHKLSNCGACILLDITESNAVDSLSGMQALLRARPKSFCSIKMAMLWTLNSKTCTNLRASQVSVPGTIKNEDTNVLASVEVYQRCERGDSKRDEDNDDVGSFSDFTQSSTCVLGAMAALLEEADEEKEEDSNSILSEGNDAAGPSAAAADTLSTELGTHPGGRYVWRIDLAETERFWAGWFDRLSHKFVTSPTQARMLILAGSTAGLDRDADMLKGQIMGKFVHATIPNSGHLVHENEPEVIATHIIQLLRRHRLIPAAPDDLPTCTLDAIPGCSKR